LINKFVLLHDSIIERHSSKKSNMNILSTPENDLTSTPVQPIETAPFVRRINLVAFIIFASLATIGCSDSSENVLIATSNEPATVVPAPEPTITPATMQQVPEPQDPTPEASVQQDANGDATEVGDGETVLGIAARLFGKAKSKSGTTATGASQWVQDKLSGAADASSQSADDTLKWANETFESLKSQGLTTAQSTSEWLGQDYNNMESWEYKVVTLKGTDEELATQLNELGKVGWDCFNTESNPTGTRFYFKKQTFSYMRHLPFKDIIKLVPAMGGEEK